MAETDRARFPSCEICGTTTDRGAQIHEYIYYRCRRCAHLFVFPRPPHKVVDPLYQQEAYYDAAESQSERLCRDARDRVWLLGRICESFGLSKRVLDVGCATGIFLRAALDQGWHAEGVEPSAHLSEKAQARTGTRVHVGTTATLPESIEPFPVVAAWDVIEHAVDPRSFFRDLVRRVSPGGLIALSTPLSNGLPARVMGERFPMLTPPEHLSLFSRASLDHLARQYGGDAVHFSSFSNLDVNGLSSGLSRLLWHRSLEDLGVVAKSCVRLLAGAGAWVPALVDRAGLGTEMLVVFRCLPKHLFHHPFGT
jgi:SAM-dependent methyltransferase